jgi:hypothetical protein
MESDLPVLIKPLEVEFNGVGQYRHAETVQDLAAISPPKLERYLA